MIAAPSAAADITSTAREKPCWASTWPADVMTSTRRDPASFTNLTSGSSVQVSTARVDRKSTRLNSSHDQISYAVFCLKKKKNYQAGGTGEFLQHMTRDNCDLPYNGTQTPFAPIAPHTRDLHRLDNHLTRGA